jgi:hypothetical protein
VAAEENAVAIAEGRKPLKRPGLRRGECQVLLGFWHDHYSRLGTPLEAERLTKLMTKEPAIIADMIDPGNRHWDHNFEEPKSHILRSNKADDKGINELAEMVERPELDDARRAYLEHATRGIAVVGENAARPARHATAPKQRQPAAAAPISYQWTSKSVTGPAGRAARPRKHESSGAAGPAGDALEARKQPSGGTERTGYQWTSKSVPGSAGNAPRLQVQQLDGAAEPPNPPGASRALGSTSSQGAPGPSRPLRSSDSKPSASKRQASKSPSRGAPQQKPKTKPSSS